MSLDVDEMPEVDDEAFIDRVADWGKIPGRDRSEAIDLIGEAFEYLEAETNRIFLSRQVCEIYDGWPRSGRFVLRRWPAISLVSFDEEKHGSETWTPVDQADWLVQFDEPRTPKIIKKECCTSCYTCDDCPPRVRICYTAGYPCEGDVPRLALKSVRELVSHWYRHREPTEKGQIFRDVPHGTRNVISQLKRYSMTSKTKANQ